MLQTKKNLYATALVARLSMELASQTILYRKNPAPSSRANYSLLFFVFSSVALRGGCLSVSLQKKKKKSRRAEGSCRAVWWSCDEVCFFRLLRVWLTPVELVVFFFFLFRSLLLRSELLREPSAIFPFIHLFTFHRRDMLATEKNTWKHRFEVRTMQSQRIILCARHRLLLGRCQFPTCLRWCASVASLSPASREKKATRR